MELPKAQTSKAVNNDITEEPPLPCRWIIKQQMNRNYPTAAMITSNADDSASSDVDYGYEYVANPLKKRNKPSLGKLTDEQRGKQNGNFENGRDCISQPNKSNDANETKPPTDPPGYGQYKSDSSLFDKPINTFESCKAVMHGVTETLPICKDQPQTCTVASPGLRKICIISSGDTGNTDDVDGLKGTRDDKNCNHVPFKYRAPSRELHFPSDDDILYKVMSQQDKYCSHKTDIYSSGYQKLIKETMEPVSWKHEYQKLNKLTMEPQIASMVTHKTEPQCCKVHHHTS